MKLVVLLAPALALVAGTAASAQSVDPGCPPGTFIAPNIPDPTKLVQDACQKSVDSFNFLAPQLGVLIAGGNATLGQGGALGAGRFVIEARVNLVSARLPQLDRVTPALTGAVRSDYAVESQAAPLPSLDAAVGIFNGFPLGPTNVLALDALASVTVLREFSSGNVDVKTEGGAIRVGFGGRVGLVQESIITPGISVSFLQRTLPELDIIGSVDDDRVSVEGLKVTANSWRVTAGKNLVFLSLAVGAGQDRYSSSASVQGSVSRLGVTVSSGPIFQEQKVSRTNLFADVAVNLGPAKLVGEIGRASGGSIGATYNTFSGHKPDDALTYGSLGLRVGF